MYHSMYSLPQLSSLFDLESTLLTTVLPIIAMLLINLLFLWHRLSIMPIRFLRGELKKNKSKRALKLPNFAFIKRFRLRIILSNKGSYALLFLGIFLANFILMLGLVLRPSINEYINWIADNAVADYQYILKAPATVSNSSAEKFSIRSGEYYDAPIEQSFDVSLIGIIEHSKYLSNTNFSDDSVLVSESLWEKYKLHDGDTLEVTDTASNKKYSFKVSGFYPYAAGFAVIMPIEQLNLLVGNDKDYFNGLFSDVPLNIDQELVATVITPDTMRGAGEQMLIAFSFMDMVCLLAAVVIHLVLFVLLTKLVLDKNAHNISLMKIFGYRAGELRGIFLNTTSIVVMISLILTLLPVWFGVKLLYVEMMLRKISGYLEIITPWWCFAITLGLGICCYFAVNLLLMRRIRNISMGPALKVKE